MDCVFQVEKNLAKIDVISISRCSLVIHINSYLGLYANCVTQKQANNVKNERGRTFLAVFTVVGNYPIRLKDTSRLIPAQMFKIARQF